MLPIISRMYLEQDNLVNYLLNLSIQSALVCYICIIYSVVGSFVVSSSRFYGALCESWKYNFEEIMHFQLINTVKSKTKIIDCIEYHLDILE